VEVPAPLSHEYESWGVEVITVPGHGPFKHGELATNNMIPSRSKNRSFAETGIGRNPYILKSSKLEARSKNLLQFPVSGPPVSGFHKKLPRIHEK